MLGSVANYSAAAEKSTFVKLQFAQDVSIEVPRNWTFLDKQFMQHMNTASEATVALSGIGRNKGENQILVAANAYTNHKQPSATVRLSVRVGTTNIQQSMVQHLDPQDLRAENERLLKALRSQLPANIKSMRLLDARVEKVNRHYSVVTDKEVIYDTGPVMERLDIFYMGDRAYKLYTSYRQQDAAIFEPVVRYIRQSLTIH